MGRALRPRVRLKLRHFLGLERCGHGLGLVKTLSVRSMYMEVGPGGGSKNRSLGIYQYLLNKNVQKKKLKSLNSVKYVLT